MAGRPVAGKPQTEGQGINSDHKRGFKQDRRKEGQVSLLNNKNYFKAKFVNAVQIRKDDTNTSFLKSMSTFKSS